MEAKQKFNMGNFGLILAFIFTSLFRKTGKLIQETEENKKK